MRLSEEHLNVPSGCIFCSTSLLSGNQVDGLPLAFIRVRLQLVAKTWASDNLYVQTKNIMRIFRNQYMLTELLFFDSYDLKAAI